MNKYEELARLIEGNLRVRISDCCALAERCGGDPEIVKHLAEHQGEGQLCVYLITLVAADISKSLECAPAELVAK